LPFASQLVVEYPDERRNYMWDIAAPISLRETRIYFQFSMNFSFSTPAEELIAANAKVLAEDQPTVESQHPEELPLDLSEEFHIRADRFSTHYRQALQRLGLGSDMAS